MRLSWLTAGLINMALYLPADAQEVVGSTIVNGRPVQILADYTWKYSSATPTECQAVEGGVSFCGGSLGWKLLPSESNDVVTSFRLNDRNYGLFVVDQLGIEDGITIDSMISIVVQNAANKAGMQRKDVLTFGLELENIDGFEAKTISYAVKIDGFPIIFTNTVVLDRHRSVQVATYSVGQTLTDDMKVTHRKFLEATRFK